MKSESTAMFAKVNATIKELWLWALTLQIAALIPSPVAVRAKG
jgi:hypothetical protein